MSVYRKFDESDLLFSVIHTQPRLIFASGSAGVSGSVVGWRGNTGPSASLSLYEGVRARRDVKSGDFVSSGISVYPLDPLDTHSIDKVIFVSGSYPSTGSVRFVKIRNSPAPSRLQDVTEVDWYDEHLSPILSLYDFHSGIRDGFFTGSYDYYSFFFEQDLSYQARAFHFSGSTLSTLSASFSMGAWIKPTRLTGSHDFTIMSQRGRWRLFLTGSTGQLCWGDPTTVVSSSSPLTLGIWQHVALTAFSGSASLYVDASSVGSVPYTSAIPTYSAATSSFLLVGAYLGTSQSLGPGSGVTSSFYLSDQGFSGYLFESRVWDRGLTGAEISGNFSHTLFGTDSGSLNLLHYGRFNDGPLSVAHGFTMGSGAFDYGRASVHGSAQNMNATVLRRPHWQPNDNHEFITKKTIIDGPVDMIRALHVPAMFYGRQIATGSVRLVCNAYDNLGMQRVLVDDGRGSLYVSGSLTRPLSGEEYRGVRWNKVGNVFYGEGIVTITDPSMLDFGEQDKDWSTASDILQVSFDGQERVTTRTFVCRLGAAQANATNNPTALVQGDPDENGRLGPSDGDPSNDKTFFRHEDGTTWINAIGIYDERRNLVAVAKLAQPVRKRERDKIVIKPRIDI